MSSVSEDLQSFNKNYVDTGLRLAIQSLDSGARLIRLQMETATELFAGSRETLEAWSRNGEGELPLAYWPSMYEKNFKKLLEISQRYFSELTQTQAELAEVTELQLASLNRSVIQNIDGLTRAATATGEAIAAVVADRNAVTAASKTDKRAAA